MKWILITILCFILSTASAHAAVRITEIAWMGTAAENGQYGEWIELYNDGSDTIDLAGWKLYASGGADLIFTLTKEIPAEGYLLIERKTASMADAVPGIDDESGVFGGGGLSNTGEFLVIKDAAGAVIQSLNFSSGWPAGDASTKETMQWNGSSWITAAPTPKQPTTGDTVSPSDDNTNDGDEEVKPKKSAPKPKVHTDPYAEIIGPTHAYVHIEYAFTPEIVLENGTKNPSRGIYRWNFGDGSVFNQTDTLNPVHHQYDYPGTYTVWFGYYDSVFGINPKYSDTLTISVAEPQITASVINGTAITLLNETDDTVDLSHWIAYSGSTKGMIAPMTILSPGATITISAATLGMTLGKTVSLAAPDDYLFEYKPPVQPRAAVQALSAPEVKGESIAFTADTDDVVAAEETPTQTNNRTKEILFGAIAVVIIGLFLLLERIMARQE